MYLGVDKEIQKYFPNTIKISLSKCSTETFEQKTFLIRRNC